MVETRQQRLWWQGHSVYCTWYPNPFANATYASTDPFSHSHSAAKW